jgi:hypothetical protein
MQRSRTPERLQTRNSEPAIPAGEPEYAALEPIAQNGSTEAPIHGSIRQLNLVVAEPPRFARTPAPLSQSGSTLDDPEHRWNPLAIPAFVLALGTVAYAILGTSELVVVLAVVATLVLAAIAVRRGRTYEMRGKGFAVAALMIGALAALITLVALLAG